MANEIEKYNALALSDIEKINGFTDADIEKINGLEFTGFAADKGIFAYGNEIGVGVTNTSQLVNNSGVMASEANAVGTARIYVSGCEYGLGLAIFFAGENAVGAYVSITNLVNTSGVVSADVTGVGQIRAGHTGCAYGDDKGIFAYGYHTTGGFQRISISSLVNSSGVVSSDVTGVGVAKRFSAACEYGGDKGIYLFGDAASEDGGLITSRNLVNNSGVIADDVSGAGTGREGPAACNYSGDRDKGVAWAGVAAAGRVAVSNLINNSGVVSADVSAVGTPVSTPSGCEYGTDKGIFAHGYQVVVSSELHFSHLVNNSGVVGDDVTGVSGSRMGAGAAGY